jgi:hypothetical protein
VLSTGTQCAVPRERRAEPVTERPRTTVPAVLHPVGDLPAAVYWRRRLMVVTLLVSVLGGGGWLGHRLIGKQAPITTVAASSPAPRTEAAAPALDRVVPSLAGVRTPAVAAAAATTPVVSAAATTPAPVAGGPCADAMLSLQVRAPASVAVGSKATFDLVVTNTSPVPCVRSLDKTLREIVLLDPDGNHVWGSNDCYPDSRTDSRTLAPAEVVSFPVGWDGLGSEPTCTAPRLSAAAGSYLLRGRLDTLIGADVPVTLT